MESASIASAHPPIEAHSLLGLELEIEGDDEEDHAADYRHRDQVRLQNQRDDDDDDDNVMSKKRRLWRTYTGRRNLIALLPVFVGGIILIAVVLEAGEEPVGGDAAAPAFASNTSASAAPRSSTYQNGAGGRGGMAYSRPSRLVYTQLPRGSHTSNRTTLSSYRFRIAVALTVTVIYTAFLYRSGGARSFLGGTSSIAMSASRKLQVATWNVAAINNNPFEYWITYKEDPEYEKLMVKIESFLENPGDKDVLVPEVFTQTMFDELDQRMTGVGWPSVQEYWENDFRNRRIVQGFLKDDLLGLKRLASMPDRITNTINTADGTQVFRPTVINMYEGDLSSQAIWWKAWEKFIFDTKLKIKGKTGAVEEKRPYEMLQLIRKAKYPEITEQEEKDSLPLQTMCGAIFDAILVHMMNTASEPKVWQPLKRTMVENLNKKKVPHTLQILEKQYIDSDIITLQEVSGSFIDQARKSPLGKAFHILAPKDMDAVRDQNSVICLKKQKFPRGMEREISSQVSEAFPKGEDVPVAKGDIFAMTATSVHGDKYVVASFHGDTNGLATKPVVSAVVKAMQDDVDLKDRTLVFGMDANTYERAKPGKQQDVLDFGKSYVEHGLTSCWGDVPNPSNYTTYNARTYLQPQLNKACRSSEKREKGDVNPKDFILFPKSAFEVVQTWKDNTGRRKYEEDMAFPTLQFPSDHGILATILEKKAAP